MVICLILNPWREKGSHAAIPGSLWNTVHPVHSSHRHPWLLVEYRTSSTFIAPPSLALCDIPYILYIHRTAIPGSLRYTVHPVHNRTAFHGSLWNTVHPVHSSHRHPWLFAIYCPSMDIKNPNRSWGPRSLLGDESRAIAVP